MHVLKNEKQELSYRQQIARQLRTQYAEGIYRLKYYTVTLKPTPALLPLLTGSARRVVHE